uniref:Uncharacterized protein n=1 Tax=Leersia perrieri TaxID=77586 RepID=A0A0D9UXX5_9ORYZ
MPLAAADHSHRGGGGARPGLAVGLGSLAAAALRREHRRRAVAGGAVLASALLLVATPRLRHSPALHLFADMRNLLGVPNTLNVLTAYPLLLAGVPGLVLCLCGSGCFGISLRWEALGWFLFYTGNIAAAFGSAYYHLKPDDDRLIWDRLPMMISASSLLSILVIERVDERVGLSCLLSLLSLILVSSACERVLDDMRLWVVLNFAPCIAIPAMLFLFPPKYTHSRFWFLATGFYLLARFEGLADRKVYSVNRYFISGHSLEHLCFALVTLILTVMLSFRNIKIVSYAVTDKRGPFPRCAVFSALSPPLPLLQAIGVAVGFSPPPPATNRSTTTRRPPAPSHGIASSAPTSAVPAATSPSRSTATCARSPLRFPTPTRSPSPSAPPPPRGSPPPSMHTSSTSASTRSLTSPAISSPPTLGSAAPPTHAMCSTQCRRGRGRRSAGTRSSPPTPKAATPTPRGTRSTAWSPPATARPDAVTWTALLSAHARCGIHTDVLDLFGEMRRSGCEGSAESMAVALSACPYVGELALAKGKAIHGCGVVKGVIHGYLFVTNSLSLEVLDKMEQIGGAVTPKVISWSAVIGGFASSGNTDCALDLFRQMQRWWLSPNVVTMATVLSACTDLLALRLGRELHGHAMRAKLDRHSLLENGLINMYAKCGKVAGARKVFNGMQKRDLISWNSMMAGYGMHGLCDEALTLFTDMAGAMVEPNGITFVAVLSACSHARRVPEGRRFFNQMVRDHNISPSMEHYTCMVDLLGRAGLLTDASELVETMPMRPDLCVWGALLNSCRIYGDAAMAEATIAKVLQAEAHITGNHTLITNLYAMCGMWDESKRVRMMTKEAGLRKNPGQSWIGVDNKVVAFVAGNTSPSLAGAEDVFGVLGYLYQEMEDEHCTMDYLNCKHLTEEIK